MIHEIIPVGPLQCNCSIYGDETTREAIVIDPGDEIERLTAILDFHRLRVTAIVVTHAHIDHIGGAARLKQATGAPVYMNARDQELYEHLEVQAAWIGVPTPERTAIDADLRDGDKLTCGAVDWIALHTPGHTPGSVCLWAPAESKLIAGDTLFYDSVGRTDLPGGNHRQILASIKDKLFPLPDDVRVIPGHGQATTIGREKAENPFLEDL